MKKHNIASSAQRNDAPRQEPQPAGVSGGSENSVEKEAIEARIARRAYELYQQRGGQHGQDTDDWLAAEQEIVR